MSVTSAHGDRLPKRLVAEVLSEHVERVSLPALERSGDGDAPTARGAMEKAKNATARAAAVKRVLTLALADGHIPSGAPD